MEVKIEKISELSKLLSVKTRMSDDLFHLFGKFGTGHLFSRLSLEKHDGVSASCLWKRDSQNIKPWADSFRIWRTISWHSRYGSEFYPVSNAFFAF